MHTLLIIRSEDTLIFRNRLNHLYIPSVSHVHIKYTNYARMDVRLGQLCPTLTYNSSASSFLLLSPSSLIRRARLSME